MSNVELFRRVRAEVEARLGALGLEARGHLGADLADEWRRRVPGLAADASLDWVAFDFPGLTVWDAHVGVLADFGAPSRATVGLHILQPHWRAALELLGRGDEATMNALEIEVEPKPQISEMQLNDPWSELDLNRMTDEARRLAGRAVELYRLVRPRLAELPIAIEASRGFSG